MKSGFFKNLFSKFGFFLNLGLALLLLLSYLSVYIPPDSFWPPAFLGLAYPYLLFVNLVFVVLYALSKSVKILLSLTIILIGYTHLFNFIQLIPNFNSAKSGLKVVSFNVHHFSVDVAKKQTDHPQILDYLRKVDADIICLQETRLFKTGKLSPKEIKEALPGIKNYQLAHSISYAGPLTLSKYPILELGEIRFEHSANMVLYSDILINKKDTIRVYNCHLQSYSITADEYSITDPNQTGSGEQQLKEAKLLTKKMLIAFSIRARQARIVASHMKKCRYPIILCGDFNDTPLSYAYHQLSDKLVDSFVESGFGVSNTYNGLLPSFRIDFILHSSGFKSVYYKRDKVNLSDHFPILTTLVRTRN